jgi:hypothetical protein
MNRKQSKYRHIILLESRRERVLSEIPDAPSFLHKPSNSRRFERLLTMIPQPLESSHDKDAAPPIPSLDGGSVPLVLRKSAVDDVKTALPPYTRRRWRGWIVSYFSVKQAQRLIPMKSANFRLRCRNLSYKRKWNLVWC